MFSIKVWFTDYGHTEREVCQGETSFLQESYPHYTCSKGLSRWIDKHNRYSTDDLILLKAWEIQHMPSPTLEALPPSSNPPLRTNQQAL